jgi:hypothetical protein
METTPVRRTTKKLLALGAAATLGLAACGDDEVIPAQSGEAAPVADETETTEDATEAEAVSDEPEATTDDAASQLRAELTTLLQEHVHLVAMAAEATIDAGGGDDPAAEAALDAVEESSDALGDVLAGVPSVDDADAFVDVWNDHVDRLVEHARSAAADGDDEADDAVDETATDEPTGFEEFQQTVADFFEEITDGEVNADEFYGELEMHVTSMTTLIESLADEDGEAGSLLDAAAGQMGSMAADLASAIVAAHPDDFPGDPASVPSDTRARLTSALVEHTYLAGMVVAQIVEADGNSAAPAVQAAVSALDGSAVTLANSVGAAAGNDQRQVFLRMWREHAQAIRDYAAARASDDQAAADEAMSALEAFPPAVGAFFEEITGGAATADALGAGLETHLSTLTTTIDAFVEGSPDAYTELRAAAQHMPALAADLARAMVAAAQAEQPPAGEGDDDGELDESDSTDTGGGTSDDTDAGDTGTGTDTDTGDTGTGDTGTGDTGTGDTDTP